MKKSVFLFIAFFISSNLLATTISWTGSDSDDWANSSNWSPKQVPTAIDDVVINVEKPCILYSGNATILSLTVEDQGHLTIASGSDILINSSITPQTKFTAVHLINGGSLMVGGKIAVTSYAGEGLNLDNGNLTNLINGSIVIENISNFNGSGNGIVNGGTIDNQGSISISNTSGIGIYSSGQFLNNNTGSISMDNTQIKGIENHNTFTNNGSLIIKKVNAFQAIVYGIHNLSNFINSGGNITIQGFPRNTTHQYEGIFNSSSFENRLSGSIIIKDLDAVNFSKAIQNNSTFLNNSNSTLTLSNVRGRPFSSLGTIGINNSSTFENIGTISITEIEGTAINNNQNIINSGFIGISDTPDCIKTSGSFTNQLTGFISLDGNTQFSANSTGIDATGAVNNQGKISGTNLTVCTDCQNLDNSGEITFQECSSSFQNNFTNSGLYKVSNATSGIVNHTSLINQPGGQIVIDSSENFGIKNETNAAFENNGSIILKKTIEGILNLGTVYNSDTILIDTTYKMGIGISSNSSGSPADTQIVNQSGGVIIIGHMPSNLNVAEAISIETKVINEGEISIRDYEYATGFPIVINGMLENHGELNLTDLSRNAIRVNSNALLSNEGTIRIDSGTISNLNFIQNESEMILNNGSSINNEDTLLNSGMISCHLNSSLVNNQYALNTGNIIIKEGGILNTQNFENRAIIDIARSGTGINNRGTFITTPSSQIYIDSSSSFSIYNYLSSYFENSGDITITNGLGSRIFNDDRFLHKAGHIYTGEPIRNNDTLIILSGAHLEVVSNVVQNGDGFGEDYMQNQGTITLRSAHLQNYARLENEHVIEINPDLQDSTFEIALLNHSIIENQENSQLVIKNNFGGNPMIRNLGKINNYASIILERGDDQGIENANAIHNHGLLSISDLEGIGLYNIDTLINHFGGEMIFNNTTTLKPSDYGIINAVQAPFSSSTKAGLFVNNNTIEINKILGSSGIGIANRARFLNNDSLSITNAKIGYSNESTNLSSNEGVMILNECQEQSLRNIELFTNNYIIQINNAVSVGISNIEIFTGASAGVIPTFVNNSEININGQADQAILSSGGDRLFTNSTNGHITLSNLKSGIKIQGRSSDNSIFQNQGTIQIANLTGAGINVNHRGVFENQDTILMNDIDTAIYLSDSGVPAIFDNKSMSFLSIDNRNQQNKIGILNLANFFNRSCAYIEVYGSLISKDTDFYFANFENHGFFVQYSDNDNDITGTALNNGIFSNVNGVAFNLNNVTNNGMYLSPISGAYSCNDVVNNFYTGTGTGITGSNLFTDSIGSTSAGSMNIQGKTLNLSNQNEDLEVFWGQMTQNGCTKLVPIPFSNEVTSCNPTSCAINIWTGLAFDNNWHSVNNWSLGIIPMICHEVKLNNGANCTISPGQVGECYILEIDSGANFMVMGELIVSGQ